MSIRVGLNGYRWGSFMVTAWLRQEIIMAKANLITAAILAASLTGCATPPGRLNDSDFIKKTVYINVPPSDALSSFYEGLRYCGPTSGGFITTTQYGVPECLPMGSDGITTCDMFIGGFYGGRSDYVIGRVDFSPKGSGTSVDLRVQTYVANKGKILATWEGLIRNQARTVCP